MESVLELFCRQYDNNNPRHKELNLYLQKKDNKAKPKVAKKSQKITFF